MLGQQSSMSETARKPAIGLASMWLQLSIAAMWTIHIIPGVFVSG